MAHFYFDISYNLNGAQSYKDFYAKNKLEFYQKLRFIWDEAVSNIGLVNNEPFLSFTVTNNDGKKLSLAIGSFDFTNEFSFMSGEFENIAEGYEPELEEDWLELGLDLTVISPYEITGEQILDLIFNFENNS